MDKDYCHIILAETLSITGIEHVQDENLRTTLEESEGDDLEHIPSTPFTIVPESKFREIRRGIGPIILCKFKPSPDEGSFTATEVANEALDFLTEHMDSKVQKQMIKAVEEQIRDLQKRYLKDYIETDGEGIFTITEKGSKTPKSPNSMEKVGKQISAWMNETSLDDYQTRLE